MRKLFGNAFSDERSYNIQMVLPQFQTGSSEVIAGVYTATNFDEADQIITRPNAALTQLFRDKLREAMQTPGANSMIQGTLTLNFSVDFGQRANVIWIYSPMPNVYTPLRMLRDDGSLRQSGEFVGGMLNDAPRGRM
ncbi:hypothetical protein JMK10_12815 [Rhodovulum sulfidophilum]|uniref:hypothetical protein n=1 Tax=Rhodovulum sulfidophilum TaxID=35806 RepID=UPI001920904F|nr:hypothetical protein [Rhodovulum sulfidophilum]MBL3576087.1 hypothetical protein [Rhodovulum sulfidophilum]MCE8433399.1 hypothetical protein [Rhodovulum sulfidophilum]MCF4117674.1 hypothetical protein [Rhodovulum sulfidophilum]